MNILVCISVVPDTTTKIRFADDNTRLDVAGVQWVINPWDELSLTRALELKDDASAGVNQVSIAHVGTTASEPTLRKALAMGADNAFRVNGEFNDAYQVAAGLAEVIKAGQFDMVLCGIESSDYNGSNVGSMLAEMLELPSVSAISSLKVEDGKALIIREFDGGKEVISVFAPFVGIVQKGIAKEPRIASMRGIMQARTKPIQVIETAATEAFTRVIRFEPPQPRAACKFIDPDNAGELISLLQKEAKLL